jgi:hypothetical protein
VAGGCFSSHIFFARQHKVRKLEPKIGTYVPHNIEPLCYDVFGVVAKNLFLKIMKGYTMNEI